MITEDELRGAIAECYEQKNPNANTCIKLASYYSILDHMVPSYSKSAGPSYNSGSEFSQIVTGLDINAVLKVMDELMDAVSIVMPKLYDATMDKLSDL